MSIGIRTTLAVRPVTRYNANNVCIHTHMAYNYQFNFPPGSGDGKFGQSLPTSITFTDIFDGTPQFYAGSTILVQEILDIVTTIVPGLEHLVDIDKRWFSNKEYLGTYQFNLTTGYTENEFEGGSGFLTSQLQRFKRYSTYTIVAAPDTPVAISSTFTIDNCNYQLGKIGATIAGVAVELQTPLTNENLFKGRNSLQKAPLRNANYNPFFIDVGLFLNPGCQPIRLYHTVQIINVVATNWEAFPDFTCSTLGG